MVVNPLVEAAEGSDHVLVVHVVDVDLEVVRLPPCFRWHTRPKLQVDLQLHVEPKNQLPTFYEEEVECDLGLRSIEDEHFRAIGESFLEEQTFYSNLSKI